MPEVVRAYNYFVYIACDASATTLLNHLSELVKDVQVAKTSLDDAPESSTLCQIQIEHDNWHASMQKIQHCQVVDAVSDNGFNYTDPHPISTYSKLASILTVTV